MTEPNERINTNGKINTSEKINNSIPSQSFLLNENASLNNQLLNPVYIEQILEMDPRFDLINNLQKLLLKQIDSFKLFLNSEAEADLIHAGKEAHRMKSSFGSLGLVGLFEVCKAMELLGKSNSLESGDKLIEFQSLRKSFFQKLDISVNLMDQFIKEKKNGKQENN